MIACKPIGEVARSHARAARAKGDASARGASERKGESRITQLVKRRRPREETGLASGAFSFTSFGANPNDIILADFISACLGPSAF